MGSGARVPLRFSPTLKIRGGPQGASSVGLFPGAIVALKGRNGGGGMFVVEEILAVRYCSESSVIIMILNVSLSYRRWMCRPSRPAIKASLWQWLVVHTRQTPI